MAIYEARAPEYWDARDWDFDAARRRARAAWNGVLSRATARGLTEEQETIYYTALYHAFVQPSDMADADGRFRDARGKVQTARTGRHYTSLSLWDTFRACHPLYTLVTAECRISSRRSSRSTGRSATCR